MQRTTTCTHPASCCVQFLPLLDAENATWTVVETGLFVGVAPSSAVVQDTMLVITYGQLDGSSTSEPLLLVRPWLRAWDRTHNNGKVALRVCALATPSRFCPPNFTVFNQ